MSISGQFTRQLALFRRYKLRSEGNLPASKRRFVFRLNRFKPRKNRLMYVCESRNKKSGKNIQFLYHLQNNSTFFLPNSSVDWLCPCARISGPRTIRKKTLCSQGFYSGNTWNIYIDSVIVGREPVTLS